MQPEVNNEHALLAATAQGNEQAFRVLFDRYMPRILAFMRRSSGNENTARELAQEVFVNIWTYRSSLGNVSSFSSYVYKTAARVAGLHFRKQAVSLLLLEDIQQPGAYNSTDTIETAELMQLIREGIAQLPDKRQEIFLLSREKGLSRQEIARHLGISEHTVKNQLTTAANFLKTFLRERGACYYLPWPLLLKIFFAGIVQ